MAARSPAFPSAGERAARRSWRWSPCCCSPGIGIILQNEAAYRDLQAQETRVQAEILAASVTAALDFGDAQAAQEAVDAIRVNRQVRTRRRL